MSQTMNEYVGQAIHMRLWRQGIPQRELAEVLGIGQSTMSKKLRGSVNWTVQELVSSAVFLDVPPVELLPRLDSNQEPAGTRNAKIIPLRPVMPVTFAEKVPA